MYVGRSKVIFAGEPERDMPVDRVPSWPYLESKLAYLDKFLSGGEIRGLIGLSALGRRKVLRRREGR